MAEYATRLANGLDTAARMRRSDSLALTPNGNGITRGGLRPDGGGVVSINTGTMGVTVQPFTAWVPSASAAQGGYPVVLDAAKVLSIADGHATLVRTDTVAAQVRDTSYDGSGSTDLRVLIVQGTPGAGAPSLPVTTIPLFNINVPAGASAGTGGLSGGALGTDRRTFVVASGGILPTTANPASPYVGQPIYRTDNNRLLMWNGTLWQPSNPAAMPFFKGAINSSTAVSTGTDVTFTSVEDNYAGWATNKYTVPIAGLYRVSAAFKWNGTLAAGPSLSFWKGAAAAYTSANASSASAFTGLSASTVIRAAASDLLSVRINGNSFTTQADSPAEGNVFLIEYLRP